MASTVVCRLIPGEGISQALFFFFSKVEFTAGNRTAFHRNF